MRGFIAALVLLILIVAAVAVYGYYWRAETEALYEKLAACAGEPDEQALNEVIRIVEEKRSFWHLTLRQGKVYALQSSLGTARYYCTQGNTEEMNRYITDALDQLAEWKEVETFSFWSVL